MENSARELKAGHQIIHHHCCPKNGGRWGHYVKEPSPIDKTKCNLGLHC